MKKNVFAILFCLSAIVLLSTSCKHKKGGSGEAYTLKMRLNKGDKFGQDLDMNMKMAFTVMGQQMDMNMAIKGATSFEVLDSSGDSKELAMTYNKMNSTVEMKSPDGETRNMGNNDAVSKVVGKTIKMTINNKNEIVEIEGIENLIGGDSTGDPATREQMKKLFSKEQMNSLFGMMFQMYPDKPVRVGDSWEKETEVSVAGINMKMFGEYELTNIKDGIAYVEVNGKYKGKGTMKQGEVEIEMDMSGGQKGNINIGLADGYVKDSQLNMDLKADMKARGQKIPVTVKGYYLIKGN